MFLRSLIELVLFSCRRFYCNALKYSLWIVLLSLSWNQKKYNVMKTWFSFFACSVDWITYRIQPFVHGNENNKYRLGKKNSFCHLQIILFYWKIFFLDLVDPSATNIFHLFSKELWIQKHLFLKESYACVTMSEL